MSTSSRSIDLNADLGEGFPNDGRLLDLVSSASISCGAHAGTSDDVLGTLKLAGERGVVVGAHPGFADRAGFGRQEQAVTAAEVEQLIRSQFATLQAWADGLGLTLRFVKPHGALYNQAQRQEEVAEGVVAALLSLRLPVLGQPGSVLEREAHNRGLPFIAEGFPDRRYRPDGRLLDRKEPGAILTELADIEAQAVQLAEQGVATLCIHGDDPRAVENAERVRSALLGAGFVVRSFA